MSIIVCGINHKTASVALREKIFFAPDKLSFYLQDLLSQGLATEAVLLSTCNRSELYCKTEDPQKIVEWFCAFDAGLVEVFYAYQGQKAVEHLMKVACGLDSMVLGEPEILGQLKAAYSESCSVGAVENVFHRLFQQVFAVAKDIRSTTAVGACPVSIASTTLMLAKQLLSFENARVVLLGGGAMIELVLRYLQVSPVEKTWVINRNLEKAKSLAALFGAEAGTWSILGDVLHEANVLITATGSLEPVVSTAFLESALTDRVEPLYIFDIAVPRDVEASAATLPMVKLHCIDDLKAIIQENQQSRQHAAEKALEAIQEKAIEFMTQLRSLNEVSDTIRIYRQQIEAICEEELNKALRQLGCHPDMVGRVIAEKALRHFAYTFTNKLLHAPSVKLRQAGVDGRLDLLQLAKQLFVLPEWDSKVI